MSYHLTLIEFANNLFNILLPVMFPVVKMLHYIDNITETGSCVMWLLFDVASAILYIQKCY